MFLGQTEAELRLEMFEDLLERREEILEQLHQEAVAPRERADLREKLQSIDAVFDRDKSDLGEDPLIDKWEREIAEGKTPDFDEE